MIVIIAKDSNIKFLTYGRVNYCTLNKPTCERKELEERFQQNQLQNTNLNTNILKFLFFKDA